MTRKIEVRVFDQRAERLLMMDRQFRFDVRYNWVSAHGQQRMEINGLRGPKLAYYPDKPIDFGPENYLQPKSLQPFAQNRYDNFDQLLVDMLAHGYFITDYRRLQGVFSHYNEVLPMVARGYVIESYRGQVILVKREPDVIHGDIWVVDPDLVRVLKYRQLLKRDYTMKHGCYHRDVYRQGVAALDTLPERQRVLLDDRQFWITKSLEMAGKRMEEEKREDHNPAEEVAEKQGQETAPQSQISSSARPWLPKIEAPAFKKPPRAQPISPSTVLAYDDCGNPITVKELAVEARKTPPKGFPPDLVPDAPDGCSDAQWERLMLIEQVKFRRLHDL